MDARKSGIKLIHDVQLVEAASGLASERPATTIQDPLELVKDMSVEVEVRLGSASLTVEKLLDLKTGSVIVLDRTVDEPVDIFVNGKLVARGQLIASEDAFGVRVTEILSSR